MTEIQPAGSSRRINTFTLNKEEDLALMPVSLWGCKTGIDSKIARHKKKGGLIGGH